MFAHDLCHSQIEYFSNSIDLNRKDRASLLRRNGYEGRERYHKSSIFNSGLPGLGHIYFITCAGFTFRHYIKYPLLHGQANEIDKLHSHNKLLPRLPCNSGRWFRVKFFVEKSEADLTGATNSIPCVYRLVANRRLNPTNDLSFRPTNWIPPYLDFI